MCLEQGTDNKTGKDNTYFTVYNDFKWFLKLSSGRYLNIYIYIKSNTLV